MADDAKAKLLSILQTRTLPLGLDDIQWAFESDTTKDDAVAWIEGYLDDSTLLTKDELDLYQAIGEPAKLELSNSSHDTVPLRDRDIKEAIAALKSSTSAIEGHAKVLEEQKTALLQLRSRSSNGHADTNGHLSYGQERSSLAFAIEDLAFSVSEQLRHAEDDMTKAVAAAQSVAQEQLSADDRTLESLSAQPSKTINSKIPTQGSDIENWLESLSALRIAEGKARTEASLVAIRRADSAALTREQTELLAELETLKDEIDSVVRMVIGSELRTPLLKAIGSSEGDSIRESARQSHHLLSTLEYLVSRLEAATAKVGDLGNFVAGLTQIKEYHEETLAGIVLKATISASVHRPPITHRQQSSTSHVPAVSFVSQALRRMNIKPSESATAHNQLQQLDGTAMEASVKLRLQHHSTEKTIVETMSKSLASKQQDTLALVKQLYAHSSYNSILLSSDDDEKRLRGLERNINDLAPKVSSGDLR